MLTHEILTNVANRISHIVGRKIEDIDSVVKFIHCLPDNHKDLNDSKTCN